MIQDIVIFGASGFARETHQIIKDINARRATWNFLGFLDDNAANHGRQVHGCPVLGGLDWLRDHPAVRAVVAIGSTRAKRAVAQRITALSGAGFATLVHPLAWIGDGVELGEGSIVCAGVYVTCDIRIGRHVVLNLAVTVGHDSEIGDYVTIAPGANISGAVRLGAGVDFGTNATIIQGVTVGEWSIIGAGAVVVRDIAPNVTAVGMPAAKIKDLPPVSETP